MGPAVDAIKILRRANPHALVAIEGGRVCAMEDVLTHCGDMYRVEYTCNPDGSNAKSFLKQATNTTLAPPFAPMVGADGVLSLRIPNYPAQQGHVPLSIVIFYTRFWIHAHAHWIQSGGLMENCNEDK